MSKTEIIEELTKLKPEELQEIRAKLNELENVAAKGWDDEGQLSDAVKALIEERVADLDRNPQSSIRWAEAEARLKARFGE
jgi:hypothetical protein